ncbi:SAM-dependent methyltransferase [Plantactinospora sp. KBS50]|uniref:SAM-dependent methyltransferase n=1 Tax=Plantactinospora sp. KBS50 TaxID=2024580 RepID=UPI001E5FFA55|nr:SAM-dependent methyltransferase [Plantactinospora sp. KBS50]
MPPTSDADQTAPDRRLDSHTVSPARRWNYWLGGKDHFQVDRDSGDRIAAVYPPIRTAAREGRAFHGRAIRYLAGTAGIRQFLDIGAGLPAPANTHEVAQAVAPESRVLYVDNDPMVLAHARALMVGTPEGATRYLDADLREPASILESPELAETLDLREPVAILLIAVLHFIRDDQQAHRIVADLLRAVPPGSYLVATHGTSDFVDPETAVRFAALGNKGQVDVWPRTEAGVAAFFAGLELLDPGVVPVSDWRPESADRPGRSEVATYAAVGRT